jgi:hypothetical protein
MSLRFLLVAFLATTALAQGVQPATTPTPAPPRILIPTTYDGPGAYGSEWRTIVAINNLTDRWFFTRGVLFGRFCPIPEGCYGDFIGPGEAGNLIGPKISSGLLLEDWSWGSPGLAITARVAALPRNPLLSGTDLPVVREKEFAGRPVHLAAVPIDIGGAEARTKLRVYGLDVGAGGGQVRVDVREGFPSGAVGASWIATFVVAPPEAPNAHLFPACAELNLERLLVSSSAGLLGNVFEIDVVPLPQASGALARIWAFATVTDNVTNEVTVVRPVPAPSPSP